jgi:hypothetical protein
MSDLQAGPSAGPSAGSSTTSLTQEQRADQEPQLKYERLGGDVGSILSGDSASCLKASEKILALGTATGVIHILDYSGNEVRRAIAVLGGAGECPPRAPAGAASPRRRE